MKKVITIIMLFCFVLCACSKADSSPVTTPSSTNTPTPTEKAEISPTPTQAPISNKFNTTCAVCGRMTDCNEYIKKIYDRDLKDYLSKAYYLCDDCYTQVLQNETECEYYSTLVECANIAGTDEKVLTEMETKGEVTITINSLGVSFKNAGENFIHAFEVTIPEYKDWKSSKEGIITVKGGKDGIRVIKDTPIKNILESLE